MSMFSMALGKTKGRLRMMLLSCAPFVKILSMMVWIPTWAVWCRKKYEERVGVG